MSVLRDEPHSLFPLINHDCKTSLGLIQDEKKKKKTRRPKTTAKLIQDGIFINWKFGLFLILDCTTLNLLYLSLSTLFSRGLWRTDSIVVSKLNKAPVSVKPPTSSPQMGLK